MLVRALSQFAYGNILRQRGEEFDMHANELAQYRTDIEILDGSEVENIDATPDADTQDSTNIKNAVAATDTDADATPDAEVKPASGKGRGNKGSAAKNA